MIIYLDAYPRRSLLSLWSLSYVELAAPLSGVLQTVILEILLSAITINLAALLASSLLHYKAPSLVFLITGEFNARATYLDARPCPTLFYLEVSYMSS
jgi:hypothetical protein